MLGYSGKFLITAPLIPQFVLLTFDSAKLHGQLKGPPLGAVLSQDEIRGQRGNWRLRGKN